MFATALKAHDLQPLGGKGKWEATNQSGNASWNFKFHLSLEPLCWPAGFPGKTLRTKEASMMEDNPRFDPMIRRHESVGGVWGLVAAASALLLIGFIIVASFNSSHTASNGSSSPTTASRTATPPSTEGSGASSPKPFTPAPSKSGTQ